MQYLGEYNTNSSYGYRAYIFRSLRETTLNNPDNIAGQTEWYVEAVKRVDVDDWISNVILQITTPRSHGNFFKQICMEKRNFAL